MSASNSLKVSQAGIFEILKAGKSGLSIENIIDLEKNGIEAMKTNDVNLCMQTK